MFRRLTLRLRVYKGMKYNDHKRMEMNGMELSHLDCMF